MHLELKCKVSSASIPKHLNRQTVYNSGKGVQGATAPHALPKMPWICCFLFVLPSNFQFSPLKMCPIHHPCGQMEMSIGNTFRGAVSKVYLSLSISSKLSCQSYVYVPWLLTWIYGTNYIVRFECIFVWCYNLIFIIKFVYTYHQDFNVIMLVLWKFHDENHIW